jgi:antitoxin (DNA-binding transcriptional repressor) of toxin-antitoxin stability system
MTNMTDMSAVSDASPDATPSPIRPRRHVNARELSRKTAELLRAVADDGHSYAIRHFGRVVAFLVPLEGRTPQSRRGEVVYAVEPQQPLVDLGARQMHVLRMLEAEGRMVDPTRGLGLTASETMRLLATMTHVDGLLKQSGACWELTPYGARHLDRR